jgi:translocation and assembly module TamB
VTISAASRRLRRFFLRHLPLTLGGLVLFLIIVLVGGYLLASSDGFQNMVRRRMVSQLEAATGGRVEIATFHWRLLDLEAEAGGLVIHGREAPGEAPYARVERLRARMSILGLFSPRLVLRDLEVVHPALHLIQYADGTTNQPHPVARRKARENVFDTVFRLGVSHFVVEQGAIDLDNRAAAFDFQTRRLPLDFTVSNVSLRVLHRPQGQGSPESYRIEAGATDLNLARGSAGKPYPEVYGRFLATVDLERSSLIVRSLRLTALSRGVADRSVEVKGELDNFSEPRWRAGVTGDLDMRLLDALTGYPFAPEGIAHLDLGASGQPGRFLIEGAIRVDDGAYIGTGVSERGVGLTAHVRADQNRLFITGIVARLHQGGSIEGTVDLAHWLRPAAGKPAPQSTGLSGARGRPARNAGDAIEIPVDGKVTTEFHDVALDTILDMVGQQPFQRLGLDARVNGPAAATWSKGDKQTVAVSAQLRLSPSPAAVSGEAPTTGAIDATYTQSDGGVALRQLELNLPASRVEAHGRLGAYPMTSPTSLSVDFASRNMGEFDTVLRDLGLKRGSRTGAAALPIVLSGQAGFRGTWTGSLLGSRLTGSLKAAELDLETPASWNDPSVRTRFLRVDAVEAEGSYTPERIAINHGLLERGSQRLTLSGTLEATAGREPVFDGDSVLHLRAEAAKVSVEDLRPFFSAELPVKGELDARLEVQGPVKMPRASGWVEMPSGNLFGEPVERVRVQGSVANGAVKVDSFSVRAAGGSLTGSGTWDSQSSRFQVEAQGAEIDLARIEWLHRRAVAASGKVAFDLSGSGTAADPRIVGHATASGFALGGERLGEIDLTATTSGRSVVYDGTAQLAGAEIRASGTTVLDSNYQTHVKLDLSRFDLGAILKLAHLEALGGESKLAGTATLDGPLAHPEELRGEARIEELAATVAGVHLKSVGAARATLAGGRIQIEPLHVTGEDTDLNAQGSLALAGDHRLDLAASGSVNLKLIQTLDPDVTAAGAATFQVEAHGPLHDLGLRGQLDLENGSLSLEDVPNGLSQIHGTLEFNQNRLEVRSLTAMSGGGQLSVAGYLAYQGGIYANLTVTGKQVRIRYPEGVSSLADTKLRLQGSASNLSLSGDVLITRFSANPDFDFAALAAKFNAVKTAIIPPDAPSNHVRLDVHVISSSQLEFQNAFAKLGGDVDLRLRGTMASPALLGRVSVTEGSAVIAGTRYELERGDITFANPLRIDPNIDLSATARVEEYDITLALRGTPERLAVTYRSDPPLPEADVVALLALGRTQNQQRIYTEQQEQSLSGPATDTLLGGALNATVSNRVQKLFGTGSVKVDPNYLGPFGNSTSRIIVQERLGRNVTLTYATDVNTTGQQLLQADVAINGHVSLVVARDESGVFSMVLKATRRYR